MGGGGGGGDFASMIPAEFKDHPSLQSIKDMNGLVKSYVHAQSLVGAEKIVIPKKDAGPDEWTKVYEKLGRPSTPEGYQLEEAQLPEGVERDADREKQLRELLFKSGLTNAQANTIWKQLQAEAVSAFDSERVSRQEAAKKAVEVLRGEWKDQFDTNMSKAKNAAKIFGGQELLDVLDSSGLGNDPRVIKAFTAIGKLVSEDQSVYARATAHGFQPGPEQAKIDIANLQTNKEFMDAYMTPTNPGHAAAKERMNRLYQTAFP
jgi:hypothetical protein